ncbi:MAG: type II toxin-antitoxin system HicB family antitoxin [Candidatus Bipolaricaulota bacterium]
MKRFFTVEYWKDDGWFVGKLREVPGVFSQGETLKELQENIDDAYHMMLEAAAVPPHPGAQTLELGVEV